MVIAFVVAFNLAMLAVMYFLLWGIALRVQRLEEAAFDHSFDRRLKEIEIEIAKMKAKPNA